MWQTEIGVRVLNATGASVKYARVLEQVDRHVWGACVNRRGSSSLLSRTKKEQLIRKDGVFFFYVCGDLNHVRTARWAVHEPVHALANTLFTSPAWLVKHQVSSLSPNKHDSFDTKVSETIVLFFLPKRLSHKAF